MACQRRELMGTCGHYQCPFRNETSHGYQCVDIIWDGDRGYCEVGEGCLPQCPHAIHTPEEVDAANRVYNARYPFN